MNASRLIANILNLSVLLGMCNVAAAQNTDTLKVRNGVVPSMNMLKKRGAGLLNKVKEKGETYLQKDNEVPAQLSVKKPQPASEQPAIVHAVQQVPVDTSLHIGWRDGRMAEFNNAYTLRRHEFRLNLAGRTSYALTDRLEMSTYLPLIILPNLSFKYRFIDKPHFAMAYELGGAAGIIPVAAVAGIALPGGAFGGGTIGVMTGNDLYAKLFISWKPSTKLTFSVRGGASRIKMNYHGIGALVGAGGSGVGAGVFPLNIKLLTTYYYMAGFEADYAMNRRNGLIAKVSFGQFANRPGGLLYPSITYTHAMRKHFHYSAGIFKLLDAPRYEVLKQNTNNPLPFDIYYNFYWIFNNGRRHVKG